MFGGYLEKKIEDFNGNIINIQSKMQNFGDRLKKDNK